MSTLFVSYWAKQPSDYLEFRMFTPVPSVCTGWNAVRVPPRAQCFRRSSACWEVESVQNRRKCVHERTFLCLGKAQYQYTHQKGRFQVPHGALA